MDRFRLGVVVPYRNRPNHLQTFIVRIGHYLSSKEIDYEIIIVNQDDSKLFNRGMLLNIGFIHAQKLRCTHVVFHDVDMIPVDVDYSASDFPIHLATKFVAINGEKERTIFEEYFGGVTLFPVETFKQINGFSNKYWGWGYEDTDLLHRCRKHNINLDTITIPNVGKKGQALKFNGVNSFIECDNTIDLNNDATFFVTFYPETCILNHERNSDEYTVFSIPGWDFAICYNSFLRYNFCAFDNKHKPLFINSDIKVNYKTNIIVVLNASEKIIRVYQDGIFIGETEKYQKLYFYKKNPKFYLGVGKPNREKIPNYFKGTISNFAYWSKMLDENEIIDISKNINQPLTKSFESYNSNDHLEIYYDSNIVEDYQLIDLTKKGNNGIIQNCEIIDEDYEDVVKVQIPHRRQSLFRCLKHDENGFVNGGWKDQSIRWNQLRFHNEVLLNDDLMKNDGLSDLKYILHGKTVKNKVTHLNIGI